MSDVVVCLGCGRIVGAAQGWGCTCPPPSVSPAQTSSPARGPYRAPVGGVACPRCGARLLERELHDVSVLDCPECLGLFLDRATIGRLGAPEGRELRLAFPARARADVDRAVRYLQCPCCQRLMNRTNFGRISGVIVDVCKEHGVWFDAGEVNAVVAFVERGGLELTRAREAAESARLGSEQRRRAWEALTLRTDERERLSQAFISLFL